MGRITLGAVYNDTHVPDGFSCMHHDAQRDREGKMLTHRDVCMRVLMGGDYQTDRQTDRQTGERENVVDDHVGWQGPARNTRTRTLIHTHTHRHIHSRWLGQWEGWPAGRSGHGRASIRPTDREACHAASRTDRQATSNKWRRLPGCLPVCERLKVTCGWPRPFAW
mmetsp:Transcript_8480/g.24169  ORF Transcript_8480/g.24169 Transcript_8480/m.24169 type:complete len:166 (-) Transcript_8480:1563-2060(-)